MSGVGSVADKCQMVKECHHGEHGCIVTVNLWIAVEMRVLASVVWCGWQHDQMEHYICRSLVYSLLWSIAGDGRLKVRQDLGEFIRGVSTIPMPQATEKLSVIDYEACVLLCINSAQCCCCSMVLGLESYSKRTNTPFVKNPVVDVEMTSRWLESYFISV